MAIVWPEAQWERRRPPVALELDEAQELVGSLGRAQGLRTLEGGKANTNYRVSMAQGQDLVLRIYERAPGLLAREALLLERLHPQLPAPRLLAQGQLRSGEPVGVFPFVRGVHPHACMDEHSAPALGRACGEVLALLALHHPEPVAGLYADDLSLARRFESVAESFEDLIGWSLRQGRARRRLPPELRAELRTRVEPLARELEPLDAQLCLTHGDFKFSNMLAVPGAEPGEWELSALLDWEFAGPFTPLLDIAILLRHAAHFPPGFAASFAASYVERGAWLPPRWRRLARIVDIMNLVGFLNGTSSRPRLEAQALALLGETLVHTRE